MILKALGGDDGSGYTYGVIDAIKYAEKMGASICNFSFGTDIPDKNLEKVIRESKMLFVVASGNGDENKVGYSIDTKPMYPASYSYDNLISVANLQADGRLHPSSNYGYNSVDIAAPGARILSTIDSETYNLNYSSVNLPTPYAYMTGTSMSAPFVAGVAALIYSDFPGINAAQAKETILNGTKSLSALTGLVNTGGMVSAERAYNYANDNYRRFLESNKAEEIKEEAETEVKEAAKEDTEEGSDNKQENTDKNETVKKDTKEEKKVKQSKKGTRPAISFLITKTGKLKIKMSDKDIAEVRYASGNKSSSYFNKARKGIKIKLNSKNEKSLTLKKGTYTFYVIDKKGNRRIERVVIK